MKEYSVTQNNITRANTTVNHENKSSTKVKLYI